MHEGFKWLQVIQGILWPVIGFYLRHIELCRKGERSDKCCERRVRLMDQLVKVIWHPPLEGIHYEVHHFLHHLHLHNHMWWCRICDRRMAGILSLLPTWGMAALQSFLVTPFSTSALLLLLVIVGPSIPLVQLFFQVMVLLGKVFHRRG